MTLYAEAYPISTYRIRSLSAYAIEGEHGCRVRRVYHDGRVVRYRSTATVDEFMLQHKHLGPWLPVDKQYLGVSIVDQFIPKENNDGHQDRTEAGRRARVENEEEARRKISAGLDGLQAAHKGKNYIDESLGYPLTIPSAGRERR